MYKRRKKEKYYFMTGYIVGAIFLMSILSSMLIFSEPAIQVNFNKLPLMDSPNYYIVCPPKYCNARPSEISPVFSIDVNHLKKEWQEVIKNQPRLTVVAEDDNKAQYTYIQRTAFFRFPDTINVILLPLENNHSTLAIYSQSKYGYSDLGANKRRVQSWLKELIKELVEYHKE